MHPRTLQFARLSLAFIWLWTAYVSVYAGRQTGLEVLAKVGLTGSVADQTIAAGVVVDLVMGVWLLTGKRAQLCYVAQGITISAYSLLLSLIDPSYWFHPFGPLSKNVPLLAMIALLFHWEKAERS